MPTERLLMRQIREILRLRWACGLPQRAVARACGAGLGTVSEYCRRAAQAGLSWPLPDDLDDRQLEARLFQRVHDLVGIARPLPDMAWLHQALKGRRIASHRRLTGRGQPSTQPEHMPHAHRAHAEWTPSRLIAWAAKTGPATAQVVPISSPAGPIRSRAIGPAWVCCDSASATGPSDWTPRVRGPRSWARPGTARCRTS